MHTDMYTGSDWYRCR